MPAHGTIIVVKRNGTDGSHFRVTSPTCLLGRDHECDIRIQLPNISKFHCQISVEEDGEIMIRNLSEVNPTKLNGEMLVGACRLQHADVFELVDRCFRWETYLSSPEGSPTSSNPGTAPTPNRASLAPVNDRNLDKTPTTADATPDSRCSLSHLDMMAAKRVSFSPTANAQRLPNSSSRITTPTAFPPGSISKTSVSFHSPAPKYFGSPMINTAGQSRNSGAVGRRSTLADSIPEEEASDGNAVEVPATPPRGRRPSKSPGVLGGRRRSNSGGSARGAKRLRSGEMEENWEKIVSPASPDSKKLAALRTIHAAKLRESAAASPVKATKESKKAGKAKTPVKRNLLNVALESPVIKARKTALSPAKKVSVHSLITARSAKKASPVTTPGRKSVEKKTPVSLTKATRGAVSPKSPPPARSSRLSGTPPAVVLMTPKSERKSPTSSRSTPAVSPRTPLSRRYSTPASRRKSVVPVSKRKSLALTPAKRRSLALVSPDLRTKVLMASASRWVLRQPGSAESKTSSKLDSTSPRGRLSRASSNADSPLPDTPTSGKRGRSSLRTPPSAGSRRSVSASDSDSTAASPKKRGRPSRSSSTLGSASPSSSKKRGRPSLASTVNLSPDRSPASSKKSGRPSRHSLTSVSDVASLTFAEHSFSSPSTTGSSTFNSSRFHTPNCPRDQFVSPLTASKGQRSPSFALERMIRATTSPSTRKSVTTPDPSTRRSSVGLPRSPVVAASVGRASRRSSVQPARKKSSPGPGYTNVFGLKRLMRSPVKSPQADYTKVDGVKRLMRGAQKSPNQGYANVSGIDLLFVSKSPKVVKIKTPPMVISPTMKRKVGRPAKKLVVVGTPDTSALKERFSTPASSARSTRARHVEVADSGEESLPATPRPKSSAKKAIATPLSSAKKALSSPADDDHEAVRVSRSARKSAVRESRSASRSTPRGSATYQLQVTPMSAAKRSLSPQKGSAKKRMESPAKSSPHAARRSASPVKNQTPSKLSSPAPKTPLVARRSASPPIKKLATPNVVAISSPKPSPITKTLANRRSSLPTKVATPNVAANKSIISSPKPLSPIIKTPLAVRRSSSPVKKLTTPSVAANKSIISSPKLSSPIIKTPLATRRSSSPVKKLTTPSVAANKSIIATPKQSPLTKTPLDTRRSASSPLKKLTTPNVAAIKQIISAKLSSPLTKTPLSVRRSSSPAKNQASASKATPVSTHTLNASRLASPIYKPSVASPVIVTPKTSPAPKTTRTTRRKAMATPVTEQSPVMVRTLRKRQAASATSAVSVKQSSRKTNSRVTSPVESATTARGRGTRLAKRDLATPKVIVEEEVEIEHEVAKAKSARGRKKAVVVESPPEQVVNKENAAVVEPSAKMRRGATRSAAKPLVESPQRSASPLKPVIEGNTPVLPPTKRATRRAMVVAEDSPPEKTAVKRGRAAAAKKTAPEVTSPVTTTPDENAVPQTPAAKKLAARSKKAGAKQEKLSEEENSPPKKAVKSRGRKAQVASPQASPPKSPAVKPTKSLRSRKVVKASPLKVKSPSPKKSPVKRATRSTRR